MRPLIPTAVIIWAMCLIGPAQAQIDVATDILTGPPIAGGGNAFTDLGTIRPFSSDGTFQQVLNLPGTISDSEESRLFKHDYAFTVPTLGPVDGGARVQDIEGILTFMGLPTQDIRQLTMALFTDGGPDGGGALVDPPGVEQVINPDRLLTILFAALAPGDYTLRVAGFLGGFDADSEWHGEYQGLVQITPLPGALVMFVSALVGLGLIGWRRSVSQV